MALFTNYRTLQNIYNAVDKPVREIEFRDLIRSHQPKKKVLDRIEDKIASVAE